jgi:hypothetical protein
MELIDLCQGSACTALTYITTNEIYSEIACVPDLLLIMLCARGGAPRGGARNFEPRNALIVTLIAFGPEFLARKRLCNLTSQLIN